MASSFVRVVPSIVERSETSQEKFFPACVTGALVHEQRREHRASTTPCDPARIPDACFETIVDLLRDVLGRRQLPLKEKDTGLSDEVRRAFGAHVLSHFRVLVEV